MTNTASDHQLETAWAQWQSGDWDQLAQIEYEEIENHPCKAELVLLAAAAQLQLGKEADARKNIALARHWGVGEKLIGETLVAGVHNSLGKMHLLKSDNSGAIRQFNLSIQCWQKDADIDLLTQERAVRQHLQLGLLPEAAQVMSAQLAQAKTEKGQNLALLKILETEIELLHHELSIAQQRQQVYPNHKCEQSNKYDQVSEEDLLKLKSVSQLGQDLWVLERTNYKKHGFFVEFGATDGVLLSNTWLLEKEFGWQGLCAEPNPKFYSQLKKNRSCVLSDQCIGGETGKQVEFIFADAYGGSQQYADEDQHKDKRAAYRAVGKVANLTTISLHDFLRQHNAPRDIDYLSIDTEGSEYEILQAFPFDQWNIRLLTVEHNFTERRKDIRKLLEGHGYQCQEAQWDDWYER